MKKVISLILFGMFLVVFCINEVFASNNVLVSLSSDKDIIKQGDEIEIILSMQNAKTAAFTAYIYFDSSNFEYIKGPKMSNEDNNKIIYVWYDENGIGDAKNGELAKFTFKAKKDGTFSFNVNGEFFDEDGDVIETNFKGYEIRVGEELIEENIENIKTVNEDVASNKNTNLETLAIENMLLYPPFDNNVTSYNLEVPNEITDLNILAIPENEKSKVKIYGGKNLNDGNNKIEVIVTAQDGKTQKTFNLNAYRRSQTEEQDQLKEQEENENRLNNIYNKEETKKEPNLENGTTTIENDNIEIKYNETDEFSENNRNNKRNIWTYIFIILSVIIIVSILLSKYKNNEK